jgi:SagB-type dehydrogenase family enzyme
MSLCVALVLTLAGMFSYGPSSAVAGESVALPEIKAGETGSLSDLLYKRRSVRRFGGGELSLEEVARLLFAAQGITRQGRFRTVPSAGALYPLEIYVVSGGVKGLEPGVYHYLPEKHELELVRNGDGRKEIARAAVGQMWIGEAQAVLAVCAVMERTTSKYGKRGRRYVHMEAGCAAQSVSLQAADLELGTTVVGAFRDNRIASILGIQDKVAPLLLLPVGRLP